MRPEPIPVFLWELFQQLRRRGFLLDINDYNDLCRSVCLGFGINTRKSLSELCCALWAKSPDDRKVLLALLQRIYENNGIPDWVIEFPGEQISDATEMPVKKEQEESKTKATSPSQSKDKETTQEISDTEPPLEKQAVVEPQHGLPEITLQDVDNLPQSHFVFVPQYPLNYRQVVQAWRRLRRPIRRGPPVDLDIQATIRRQAETGITRGAVLVPRRVNAARLLILEDRHGSMNPFHAFVSSVSDAIIGTANFEMVKRYYFNNVPVQGVDISVLGELQNQFFPKLDSVLSEIAPLEDGYLYEDADLYRPASIPEVLNQYGRGFAIIIISEAGAARRNRDIQQLLNTIAFLKGLYQYTRNLVWLNPLPANKWAGTLAEQISRHVPMLPLDVHGSHRAVNILRGQPILLQRSL